MEGKTTIEEASLILGRNLIGPAELKKISPHLAVKTTFSVPDIPYSAEYLRNLGTDYLLILGSPEFDDGRALNIMALREKFGMDSTLSEPCFYNQDWYLNQRFIFNQLPFEWFIIRKTVIDSTRAVDPGQLEKEHNFPSAIQCTYAFFVTWLCIGELLWEYDFVWCNDKDHNGDRIYVAKYRDIDGMNSNGFSIHRHLALRNCYGSV